MIPSMVSVLVVVSTIPVLITPTCLGDGPGRDVCTACQSTREPGSDLRLLVGVEPGVWNKL